MLLRHKNLCAVSVFIVSQWLVLLDTRLPYYGEPRSQPCARLGMRFSAIAMPNQAQFCS
jgi:hypothetical protein